MLCLRNQLCMVTGECYKSSIKYNEENLIFLDRNVPFVFWYIVFEMIQKSIVTASQHQVLLFDLESVQVHVIYLSYLICHVPVGFLYIFQQVD